MGDFVFIPAMIGQLRNIKAAGHQWKGKWINSFSGGPDGCLDYYPYLLASAWYEHDWKDGETRKVLDIPEDLIMYGDSGGYQAGRMNIEIDVAATLNWQEKNCNYGFCYDYPPNTIKIGNVRVPSSDEWYFKRLNDTLKSNRQAIELRKTGRYNLALSNIIHGTTLDRRDTWYEAMKDLPFEHMCIGTRPHGSPLAQTFALCHLHSKGYNKWIHILGVGSRSVLPIFPYVKQWFEHLTIDSSSYGQGCRVKEYYVGMNDSISFGRKPDHKSAKAIERIKSEGLSCKCPTCNTIEKSEVDILWSPGSVSGALITCHNLRTVLNFVDDLNALHERLAPSEYKEHFKQLAIKKQVNAELSIAFDFIDTYVENGIEAAYNKYLRFINPDTHKPVVSPSLFD